jgi:hypothetical protein
MTKKFDLAIASRLLLWKNQEQVEVLPHFSF